MSRNMYSEGPHTRVVGDSDQSAKLDRADLETDQAFVILNNWLSERAEVECCLNLGALRARLRGRLKTVASEAISVISEDSFSELALSLTPGAKFGFGQLKGVLAIFLGVGDDETEDDFVTFTKIDT